ncbi:hypothetical protein N9P82_00215 [bacterium]|nr:hypothetical protein [bacterium]
MRVEVFREQRLHLGSDPLDALRVRKVSHPDRVLRDAAHDFLKRVDPRFVVTALDGLLAYLFKE